MSKNALKRVDDIVTTLNNIMEKHCDVFCDDFGCEPEDLVGDYGFGYYPSDPEVLRFAVADDGIAESLYTLDEAEKMISGSAGDDKKEIDMIYTLQEEK